MDGRECVALVDEQEPIARLASRRHAKRVQGGGIVVRSLCARHHQLVLGQASKKKNKKEKKKKTRKQENKGTRKQVKPKKQDMGKIEQKVLVNAKMVKSK